MRIALLISSLARPGGAERVLSAMANHWAGNDVPVTLITLDAADRNWYPLDERITRVGLKVLGESAGLTQALINNSRRLRDIRRAIAATEPDVLISFIDVTNVLALLGTLGLDIPVIVSERVHPAAHQTGRAWSLLRRTLYPRAAGVVVQTQGTRAWAEAFIPADRVHVVPNPVTPALDAAENETARGEGLLTVGMGRLTRQKGFDLLIAAFARCPAAASARLVIVGEGPERETLQRQIDENGLGDRVVLAGSSRDPAAWLRAADVFVLSSRYEGFPNVLLEAMAAGVPVISFDCRYGPGEIVRHEVDGLLVPDGDTVALTAALGRLLADAGLRARFGERGPDVAQRFSLARVMEQWRSVVDAVTAGTAAR